jgi:hypothetical protein
MDVAYSEEKKTTALNIQLEDMESNLKPLIPDNKLLNILFFGGRKTKEAKLEWYKHLSQDAKILNKVNFTIVLQFADIPFFVSKSYVRSKVTTELKSLVKKQGLSNNARILFDWNEDLIQYYNLDLSEVMIVLVDPDMEILYCIMGNYSKDACKKLLGLIGK